MKLARAVHVVSGMTLLSFVLVTAAAAQQPADSTSITLDDAIQRALRVSPAMVQSRGAIRNASAAERSAWGAFLPRLSVSSGANLSSTSRFNPQTNTIVSGSADSYSARASASLDLFNPARLAGLTAANAEARAAEAGLIEQRYAVILSAKQAFFNVLRADDLIEVSEAGVERGREGLEAAEERLAVGAATRSDVLRATLELNQARQALLEAEAQRRTAAFALGSAVGVDGPVGARMQDSLAVEPLDLPREEIVQLAVRASPSVRAAAASVEAAEAGVGSARAQYLPSLGVSAGTSWFNDRMTFAGGRSSWGLSLGISLPVFNGFQREAQITRANVQATVAEARLRDTRLTARAEAQRLLAAVGLAEQQLALAEDAVRVAREDLRVQEERYRLGAATILERITSQVNLDEAERALIAARYDYHIARAQLEALVGREL